MFSEFSFDSLPEL